MPKPNQEKEVETNYMHDPKGVPNNYALQVVEVIFSCIRPIISMQTYTRHVIVLLVFW